jgi:hypothetical protein
MRHTYIQRLVGRALCAALFALPVLPAGPPLSTLSPGAFREISQTLPINIVFLGYQPGAGPRDVNEAAIRAGLPATYRTINRYPTFWNYGVPKYAGQKFQFQYNFVHPGAAYENSFFQFLLANANPQPLTDFQTLYNGQTARSRTVTENLEIDAFAVERWLAFNPPAGVDTTRYTVFLINWFGRSDFKHHTYTRSGDLSPDTGLPVGNQQGRRFIAWGGTAPDDPQTPMGAVRRVWFADLSAGPELWTENFDIQTADLDGDGVLDYRFPPIWEYGTAHPAAYRVFNTLNADLSKIIRYVGINLLFTPSPLYPAAISPPQLPDRIELDINHFQQATTISGLANLKPNVAAAKLNALQPLNTFTAEVTSHPFAGRIADVYGCSISWLSDPNFLGESCYGFKLGGYAYLDLFLYFRDHLNKYIEGDADYELPVFLFTTDDALSAGYSGVAEPNYRDGRQSYVFQFLTPRYVNQNRFGHTSVLIHEAGHHLGLSHPHDGYDSESNTDYFQSGPTHFAWLGDESSTPMSYHVSEHDFGQFNRDSNDRYLTSTFLNNANQVLEKVYADPHAHQQSLALIAADSDAADALTLYDTMQYRDAAAKARLAYKKVLAAAAALKIKIEPQSSPADYRSRGKSYMFTDTLGTGPRR